MKILLLRKVVSPQFFAPVGAIIEMDDWKASIMIANSHAQMIGPDGRPISLPALPVKKIPDVPTQGR